LLSFGCTIIRETFNTWTPVYLRDYLGYSVGDSAGMSAIFPGVGAVSVLLAGWLSDRLGLSGRSLLLFVGLGGCAAALLALTFVPSGAPASPLPLAVIGIVAFCLLGPYSYLGGAFALDFGGKQASAASSGIIDGIGYLGGILAGDSVARLSVAFSWRGVFMALALVSAAAGLCAGYLHALNARAAAAARSHGR
ncbi:MAG: MFS transporter, partial [Steroidobacteraceae bacterium]